jgi:hypothetical protein
MATLNTALGVYAAGGGTSFGSSSVIYVSIPDPVATSTSGDQCQGLGLPSLPSTYSYHCAASSTLRSTDATGWIPINFSSIALGSTLGSLPIDPLNQSSSRLYYTYTTNGTQYEVTSALESAKYKLGGSNDVISSDGGTLASTYEKGTKFGLEPLDYGDSSLVGYWPLTEGTGTVAYDDSGNNSTGTWNGTQAGSSGYYSAGKIGPWAGAFDGSTDQINIGTNSNAFNFSGNVSGVVWIKTATNGGTLLQYQTGPSLIYMEVGPTTAGGTANKFVVYLRTVNNNFLVASGQTTITDNNWHLLVFVRNIFSQTVTIYVDGQVDATVSYADTSAINTSGGAHIIGSLNGGVYYFTGLIDDVRIYNRALSASEIAAMYAGGK